jgi:hypothetical protein
VSAADKRPLPYMLAPCEHYFQVSLVLLPVSCCSGCKAQPDAALADEVYLSNGTRRVWSRRGHAHGVLTSAMIPSRLLLLDEPFGALDPQVRRSLRQGLRDIIDCIGITAIFVTHDQVRTKLEVC